jgi:hypothetical protein
MPEKQTTHQHLTNNESLYLKSEGKNEKICVCPLIVYFAPSTRSNLVHRP